jgi:mRNA interferase HicA
MSELPTVTGTEAIAALSRAGFETDRITGSHHVLKKAGHRFNLAIPVHGRRPLKRGTLRRLIRDAGLTVDEFCALLAGD